MDKFTVFIDNNADGPYIGPMNTPTPAPDGVSSALVHKSNTLVNAIFDISLQGNRLLAFAISKLDPHVPLTPGIPVTIEINVLEFAELFGIDPRNAYREVEATAELLENKRIQLAATETLTGRRSKTRLVHKQDYDDGAGRVWLRFDEDLVPHLLGLQQDFTVYRIKDVYRFAKASSWRVYELLKQFKDLGKREFSVEEFKQKVGVWDSYKVVADLRKRVIDPAIAEINMTSDLLVDYEQRKRGRRIVGFLFLIRDNQGTKTPQERIRKVAEKLDTNADYAPELSAKLHIEYRVSPKQARQLGNLAHAAGRVNDITERLPRIRARYDALDPAKRKSLGGYVFKAVKNELTPKQANLPFEKK